MAPEIVMYSDKHLLGLPAELRNNIYHNVFVDGGSSEQLRALLSCKQVYNEAVYLAFAATDFHIDDRYLCDSNEEGDKWKSLNGADRLRTHLKSLITKVNFSTVHKLDNVAVLFENGVHPTRIIFNNIWSDDRYFWEEYKVLAKFDLTSAALFDANPNLHEVVFKWSEKTLYDRVMDEAALMLYHLREEMGLPLNEAEWDTPDYVTMDRNYDFTTRLRNGEKHEWTVIFEHLQQAA